MVKSLLKTVGLLLTLLMTPLVAAMTYLTGLVLLAIPRWQSKAGRGYQPFFYVLIPAHDEELVIARTIASLQKLDYPARQYKICVVADNCTDGTARIVRAMGATVYERFNPDERSKGYALQWLLNELLPNSPTEAGFVFVDADTVLSANFLQEAAQALDEGAEIIQGYYGVSNPEDSWRSALRYVALTAMNFGRLLGRDRLGISVGLRGNGMVFSAATLRQLGWPAYTQAEDAEMHTRLVLAGQRVRFMPQGQVWALMPVTGQQARSQDVRWEGGRFSTARQFVPQLLKGQPGQAWRTRLNALDAAVELALPPLSVVAGLGGIGLMAGIGLGSAPLRRLAGLLIGELTVYILASLVAARAPLKVWQALLYAPFFIGWKIGLYVYALVKGQRQARWVRTSRQPH